MSTPTLTPRQRAVARHLDVLYHKMGLPCDLVRVVGEGVSSTPVLPIFRSGEAEEGLDGQAIEARIKGYAAQLRASELTALGLTPPFAGARLELQNGQTFDGHAAFVIDADPISFGRGADQKLFKLSAAPDVDEGDLV